jgi:hypothetical protein
MMLLGLTATGCLVTSCGSSSNGFGSLSGKTPQQILTSAAEAIAADHDAFRFVDQSRVGHATTTVIGSDSDLTSEQTLSGAGAALQVERVTDGTIYLRGAAGALVSALGLSQAVATAYAGRWIFLSPSDGPYGPVNGTLNPLPEIDSFFPDPPYELESPRVFHGATVVGVIGHAPASAANGTGHALTLFVPTTAPHTPVGATLTFGTGASSGTEAVVFDHWGEAVQVTAPPAAVAYSTLPR